MRVRQATCDDTQEIRNLILRSAHPITNADISAAGFLTFMNYMEPHQVEKRLLDLNYWTKVCESDDGTIVGMISFHGSQMEQLFVAPEFQRQGVATRLWEVSKEGLGTNGVLEGMLVYASTEAIAMYKKFGFKATGKARSPKGIRYTPMKL